MVKWQIHGSSPSESAYLNLKLSRGTGRRLKILMTSQFKKKKKKSRKKKNKTLINVDYANGEYMYSELGTLSSGSMHALGNLDGKKACNKVSLLLFINSMSTHFRKDVVNQKGKRKGTLTFSLCFLFFLFWMGLLPCEENLKSLEHCLENKCQDNGHWHINGVRKAIEKIVQSSSW